MVPSMALFKSLPWEDFLKISPSENAADKVTWLLWFGHPSLKVPSHHTKYV